MMKYIFTIIPLLTVFVSPAMAEPVRLVISPPAQVVQAQQQKSFNPTGCVATPDGQHSWCIGTSVKGIQQKSLQQRRRVVEIESYGYRPDEIARYLTQHANVGLVEADVTIREISSSLLGPRNEVAAQSEMELNDPNFHLQLDYLGSAQDFTVGMDVLASWNRHSSPEEQISVAVLDSSFFSNSDVAYDQGASFVTGTNFDQPRNHDFSPREESLEFCTGHGLGVSAVIGATANNNEGSVGVARNVALHPLRVLDCGQGFLSDAADAIDWLTGQPFEGVEPYQGNVGVINMSFAGQSDGCPTFVQSAIDEARAMGWTVVASAGNDDTDTGIYAPVNCDGVVGVGAVNKSGERASFSNYGPLVDLTALGEDIPAVCEEGDNTGICFFAGTSFSGPLVAAIAAETMQVTGADNELTELAIDITANADALAGDCEQLGCGTGVVNMAASVEFAQLSLLGRLNTISHALAESSQCEQVWFVDFFGQKGRLCELYQLTFQGGYARNGQTFELMSLPVDVTPANDDSWTSVAVVDTPSMVMADIDVQTLQYGVRVCTGDTCNQIQPMNADQAQLPQACL